MKKNPIRISALVFALIILAVAFYFRPIFHPYVMSLWRDPLGTLLVIAAAVLLVRAVLVYGKVKLHEARGRRLIVPFRAMMLPAILGVGLLVTSLVYRAVASDVRLAQAYKTYTFSETTSLPVAAQNRLVPLPVAARFGADALQRPTEQAFTWRPQLWDGKFSWVAALTPSGDVRRWFDKAAGVQVVDATTTERKAVVVEQRFAYSEGIKLTDDIRWQLHKRNFLVDLPEVFYGKVDGQVVAVVPIIKYSPGLIRHPVHAGAYVVSADGRVEQLDLEAAKKHPAVVSAGRLYPESYTRFMHESYALKGGVFNKWFRHVDQTEISDPAGERNAQPYMLAAKNGLMWLSAADPWGKSFGIYKVFITDAITGENQLYSTDKDSALTGAAQAVGYVRSAKPQYNWASGNSETGSSSGNIMALEPRPVFVNNQLFWMVSITTTDAKGVNETCFINAKDNKVTCAANEAETVAFIASGTLQAKPADATAPEGEPVDATREAKIKKLEETLRKALEELDEVKQAQ